jgi:hypothetical protein
MFYFFYLGVPAHGRRRLPCAVGLSAAMFFSIEAMPSTGSGTVVVWWLSLSKPPFGKKHFRFNP